MAIYGQPITVQYVAWNTLSNSGQTGDADNHTLRWVKDGVAAAPTNSPTELDPTNCAGVYTVSLTEEETSCWVGTLCGRSSTPHVVIMPVTFAFERLSAWELAAIEAGVWDAAIADHLQSGSAGKTLYDSLQMVFGISGGVVQVISPVSIDGRTIELIQGDDFTDGTKRPLIWRSYNWPDLTGATVTFTMKEVEGDGVLDVSGEVVQSGDQLQIVKVELTNNDTSDLVTGVYTYDYDLRAVLASAEVSTLVMGRVGVKAPASQMGG